ncbi:EamA-like transporter family protein [Rhodoblastus acidophilus]|uniref:EamA-like transporter family protein n=1 Tax=Rhodoblastus acidophilus TaxID=1074 RepID=A0A212REV9_RHOAC|nr:DMT family transporter [Rhodoblastus acidophilus]PPQ39695.1 EamA/RhaT family transporter [Rhodoblastus acidophilus]RAI24477.1 EamA/RhaT family transporter [Rhodoblastus acidophilus]SNB70896.1 EamA-like transporter family protein [Rhodoblastus acidophilus]
MSATHRPDAKTLGLTALAMVAFAANSLLCRAALAAGAMDAASFTFVRLASGAAMLWLLLALSGKLRAAQGSWRAAFALFAYAAGFSLAYRGLPAGTGALLLFGAVQATMIGAGLWRGERFTRWQTLGFLLALAGLIWLLAPGAAAPPPLGAGLMLAAGVAWGVYSLLGRGGADPLAATAGNFFRAVPMGLALLALAAPFSLTASPQGLLLALLSGAAASGLGYALWYAALRGLTAAQGATVQLSAPVLAALGGAALLGETPGLRLVGASALVLGGVALVIAARRRPQG